MCLRVVVILTKLPDPTVTFDRHRSDPAAGPPASVRDGLGDSWADGAVRGLGKFLEEGEIERKAHPTTLTDNVSPSLPLTPP